MTLPVAALAFSGTVFAAALDAAQGVAWKHELFSKPHPPEAPPNSRSAPMAGDGQWRSTQHGHIELAARLVGVAPTLADDKRLQIAEVLRVPALTLTQAASTLASSGSYAAFGEAVVQVLAEIPRGACLADRLAHCGYLVGLWQEPLRWDPDFDLLLAKAFQPLRTRAPPRKK